MPASLNKYLDPAGLDETVLNIRQIAEGLESEMQALPYARPDGIYPDMTVGAVIGADETAQWAQRESTGSGAATVRSVQGAAVGWNQMVSLPYYSSAGTSNGVTFTVADDGTVEASGTSTSGTNFFFKYGFELVDGHKYLMSGFERMASSPSSVYVLVYDSTASAIVYRQTTADPAIFTASASTSGARYYLNVSAADIVVDVKVRPQLFDLTQMFGTGNEPSNVTEFEAMYPASYYPYSAPTLKSVRISGIRSTTAQGGELDAIEWSTKTLRAAGSVRDELTNDELVTRVGSRAYQSGDESDSSVVTDGTTTFYALATPTNTPIAPALHMSYRVQQGGTEYIIVPEGEISAAPMLTVAEPVNAGAEIARIWEAIQSLGYTRSAARPASLENIGSIDEVRKEAPATEAKEVQE